MCLSFTPQTIKSKEKRQRKNEKNIIEHTQKECIFNNSINNNKQNEKKENHLVISIEYQTFSILFVCIYFCRLFHVLLMHFLHEYNMKNKVQVNIKMSF